MLLRALRSACLRAGVGGRVHPRQIIALTSACRPPFWYDVSSSPRGGEGTVGGGWWMEIQLKIPRCLSPEEAAAQGGEAEQHAHVDNENGVESSSSAA